MLPGQIMEPGDDIGDVVLCHGGALVVQGEAVGPHVVEPHLILKLCKTKKTELLFLALFLKMLRVGGRCACIVPDGVLFGSSKAHPGAISSTIILMMCRGVRNWPFTPAVAILDRRNSYTSPRTSLSRSWAIWS